MEQFGIAFAVLNINNNTSMLEEWPSRQQNSYIKQAYKWPKSKDITTKYSDIWESMKHNMKITETGNEEVYKKGVGKTHTTIISW